MEERMVPGTGIEPARYQVPADFEFRSRYKQRTYAICDWVQWNCDKLRWLHGLDGNRSQFIVSAGRCR